MNAAELKEIADRVNAQAADPQIEETYIHVKAWVYTAAREGKYSLTLPLTQLNVDKRIWDAVAVRLRKKDSLKVVFDTEITAQYSNTDWDQEDIIKISWM